MSLWSIVGGLASGLELSAAAGGPPKLDILGFDACIMAHHFVLTAIGTSIADFVIGSETNEPGTGWDYRVLNPGQYQLTGVATDPVAFAEAIVNGFVGHKFPSPLQTAVPVPETLAVVNTQLYAAFITAFGTLIDGITKAIEGGGLALVARAVIEAYSRAMKIPSSYSTKVDLASWLARLVTGLDGEGCSPLASAARAALQSLQNAIVVEKNNDVPGAYHGVATFMFWQVCSSIHPYFEGNPLWKELSPAFWDEVDSTKLLGPVLPADAREGDREAVKYVINFRSISLLFFHRELCQIAVLPPRESTAISHRPLGVCHPKKERNLTRFECIST
jgi:hypothetical protein